MTYEELREEWDHGYTLREMAREVCGTTCSNCGATEGIEYHHIVPLKLGGTNRLSNIVALCHSCHCAAHHGRHMRDYCNKEVSGRPIKEVNDAIIYAYVNGVIGTKQFKELSGMSEGTHIADLAAFREYKKKHGILKVRNNVDILLKHRGVLEVGQKVGQIIYEDGTVKDVVFKKAKKYHGFC